MNRENRSIDSIAFLDKSVSTYEKLFESSCMIEKNVKDNLLNIYTDPLLFQPSLDVLDVERSGNLN